MKIDTRNGEKEDCIYFVLNSSVSDFKEIKKIVKNINPDLEIERVVNDI